MAFGLWIFRGRPGRRLWNERASIGCIRGDAALVSPAFPRNAARIFPARKRGRDGRILVRRVVAPRSNALLPHFPTGRASSHISWQSCQSSPAGRCLSQICSRRSHMRWIATADPSNPPGINIEVVRCAAQSQRQVPGASANRPETWQVLVRARAEHNPATHKLAK